AQIAGVLLLVLIVLFAWLGPLLIDADPARQQLARFLEAPSLAHPLGYDQLGRDMLARLVHGTRLSLSLAVVSVLSAAI
ncbi:ABC transporter permease, partial [Salmonella enterica]